MYLQSIDCVVHTGAFGCNFFSGLFSPLLSYFVATSHVCLGHLKQEWHDLTYTVGGTTDINSVSPKRLCSIYFIHYCYVNYLLNDSIYL